MFSVKTFLLTLNILFLDNILPLFVIVGNNSELCLLSPVRGGRGGRGQISNLDFDMMSYYFLVRNVTNSSPREIIGQTGECKTLEFYFSDFSWNTQSCNETSHWRVSSSGSGCRLELEISVQVRRWIQVRGAAERMTRPERPIISIINIWCHINILTGLTTSPRVLLFLTSPRLCLVLSCNPTEAQHWCMWRVIRLDHPEN